MDIEGLALEGERNGYRGFGSRRGKEWVTVEQGLAGGNRK